MVAAWPSGRHTRVAKASISPHERCFSALWTKHQRPTTAHKQSVRLAASSWYVAVFELAFSELISACAPVALYPQVAEGTVTYDRLQQGEIVLYVKESQNYPMINTIRFSFEVPSPDLSQELLSGALAESL